jgi:pyruvate dehydrogenase E2 component (dihydrolipoamide acetyltransferase)
MDHMVHHQDEFLKDMQALGKEAPDVFSAFEHTENCIFAPGCIDTKTKHLIAIGICACIRSRHCAARHISEALKEGATREELVEAATVAVALGGSPALAYAATTFRETLDEFGVV